MKSRFLVLIAVVSLVLVGCSTAAPAATGPAPSTAGGSPSSPSKVTPDQVRTDAQGAVTVDITPVVATFGIWPMSPIIRFEQAN